MLCVNISYCLYLPKSTHIQYDLFMQQMLSCIYATSIWVHVGDTIDANQTIWAMAELLFDLLYTEKDTQAE